MATTQDRLIIALGLALTEIHNPGAAQAAGIDLVKMCEDILKEATRTNGVPQMIRDEMLRRATL